MYICGVNIWLGVLFQIKTPPCGLAHRDPQQLPYNMELRQKHKTKASLNNNNCEPVKRSESPIRLKTADFEPNFEAEVEWVYTGSGESCPVFELIFYWLLVIAAAILVPIVAKLIPPSEDSPMYNEFYGNLDKLVQ